jgi:DNA-binding ferritin-like protein
MPNKSYKKKIINKNKTRVLRKTKLYNNYSHENIIRLFLQMLNNIKLYHWHTHSYPQHKATDKLYDQLNKSIDEFVEIMLGKHNTRFNLNSSSFKLYTNINDFKREIEYYKTYLINMKLNNAYFNSDLMNIRDEILGHLNQFSYLLTFK